MYLSLSLLIYIYMYIRVRLPPRNKFGSGSRQAYELWCRKKIYISTYICMHIPRHIYIYA